MPDTIGQRLKEARLARHISLQDISEATRIRLRYLEALEADDYSIMPSAAQARGFLRNYASVLGLDLERILSEIQSAQPAQLTTDVSGPLERVDSISAPPQIAAPAVLEEKPRTPPFWASWLARLRKPDSTPEPAPAPVEEATPVPEPESDVQVSAPAAEEVTRPVEEPPKRRGRKKKEPPAPPTPPSSEPPTQPVKRRSKKKEESAAAAIEIAEIPAPAIEQEQADAEQLPVEEEQPPVRLEAGGESKPGFLSRLQSLFTLRVKDKNTQEIQTENSDDEAVVEDDPKPEPEIISNRPEESAGEIFLEIGAQFRERREMLSLTIEEIERHTHVRAAYVKALEEGAFDDLPSAVQTRGMLANYASFLDLDTDAILLRFADALQARHRARFADRPRGQKSEMKLGPKLPPLRTFIAGDMLFGIGMIVMLIALGVWGLDRVFASEAAKVALPTAPSITDILARTPQATDLQEVTLIPAVDTPLATLEATTTPDIGTTLPTQDVNANVQVNISAVSSTFMRVFVDGKESFSGRVLPGSNYPFDASNSVQVLTGNAAALRVTYNGQDLGLLGSFGEVVNYIYSANSITTPTPAASPTSTATPNIPATITQTFTPTATKTPTSTPTPPSK